MPVLDVHSLSSKQLSVLRIQYDSLSSEELQPLAQLKTDPIRIRIDTAINNALKIPDLVSIRELLEREPGLNAKDIVPRKTIAEEEEEDDSASLLFP
jgi:hypothetical protein